MVLSVFIYKIIGVQMQAIYNIGILKVRNSCVCGGRVDFLAFNVLLHTKSEQKGIGN